MQQNEQSSTPPADVTVLCCRADPGSAAADPVVADALTACDELTVRFVGARPGREIDPLLSGRVVVLGDDGDLAAVCRRLLRAGVLPSVEVGYATGVRSGVSDLYALPLGADGVRVALRGDPDLVSLVRDDVGGVLVGRATLEPVRGTVYVDEHRVLSGDALLLLVEPSMPKGLEVTVVTRRWLGVGRKAVRHAGRAVQIGTRPATVIADDVAYPREMERWTFYKHTEPLRLIRGAY